MKAKKKKQIRADEGGQEGTYKQSANQSRKSYLHHICYNVPWRNCIDTDLVQAPFCCKTSCQLEDSSFGSIIGCAQETAICNGATH